MSFLQDDLHFPLYFLIIETFFYPLPARRERIVEELRAAICDDDRVCLTAVKTLLLRMGEELNAALEILEFPDGADLVEA